MVLLIKVNWLMALKYTKSILGTFYVFNLNVSSLKKLHLCPTALMNIRHSWSRFNLAPLIRK